MARCRVLVIRSAGTPCPVTMKKPVSRQAASIWRATSRLSASLPVLSGDKSIIGMASAAMLHLVRKCRSTIAAWLLAAMLQGGGAAIWGPCMDQPVNRRSALGTLLAGAGAVLAPRVLRAQAGFPNRNIRIVVPVSPGGGVDI